MLFLYSIEALMVQIFDIKISENVEVNTKEISKRLIPNPLNIDILILTSLFHQTLDLPDMSNSK